VDKFIQLVVQSNNANHQDPNKQQCQVVLTWLSPFLQLAHANIDLFVSQRKETVSYKEKQPNTNQSEIVPSQQAVLCIKLVGELLNASCNP